MNTFAFMQSLETISQEKKEDKAADEVLSGEVEWEVYFNKV